MVHLLQDTLRTLLIYDTITKIKIINFYRAYLTRDFSSHHKSHSKHTHCIYAPAQQHIKALRCPETMLLHPHFPLCLCLTSAVCPVCARMSECSWSGGVVLGQQLKHLSSILDRDRLHLSTHSSLQPMAVRQRCLCLSVLPLLLAGCL